MLQWLREEVHGNRLQKKVPDNKILRNMKILETISHDRNLCPKPYSSKFEKKLGIHYIVLTSP